MWEKGVDDTEKFSKRKASWDLRQGGGGGNDQKEILCGR